MKLQRESAEGVFLIRELDSFVKIEPDGDGGTKYTLSSGKSGKMPLTPRIKLKEALEKVLGMHLTLLLYPDGVWQR